MRLCFRQSALRLRLLFIGVLLLVPSSEGQSNTASGQAKSPGPSTAAQDPTQVIQFLSRTMSWHRQLEAEGKNVNRATDLSFAQEDLHIADQVVRLAFEYARGQAQVQAKQPAPAPQSSASDDNSAQFQRLAQATQKVEQEIQDTQAEVQGVRQKLARAPEGKKKPALESQVAELQSEIGLLEARRDALQSMSQFVTSSNSAGSGGLRTQIEELARSVPADLSRPSTGHDEVAAQSSSGGVLGGTVQQPSGIWELAGGLIRLSGKLHTLNDELSASEALGADADRLRAPLMENLRSLIRRGDELSSAADTSGPAALAQQKQQLDALASEFRQTSAQMLPLSKISLLLGMYQATLRNWKESVRDDLHDNLRQLLLKLVVLAVLIALVLGLGEVWRRATFRYVHDGRRRYQFLLLRRIAIWIAIAVIIILAFASQLGSAVTFAGLLTAGIAVALQNVIVSIVGYFFLIGKYGLRVGDRVQIAGVTGEVVEIGLVRIHLMELGGPGENQPSGRVVAFSNSIVFQPTAGVFKQIPGTNFIWHEIKLTLAGDTDYHVARERIMQAVDSVLKKHQGDMEAQRRVMEMSLSPVSTADLGTKIRLHYTGSGIEATVRFPVELEKAAEVDDHLMRELLAAAAREPKLKIFSTEMPLARVGE
jgi:small-conductance mechanosensitive channel